MNILLGNHFEVQTGMYFDYETAYGDWCLFMSKTIKDSFWNYAVMPINCDKEKELPIVEDLLKKENRTRAVYVVNEKEQPESVSYLLERGYEKMSEESFMTYKCPVESEMRNDGVTVLRAIEGKEKEDFINVFLNAYGGDITPEQPYGELDGTYIEALKKSFENPQKFFHYICYDGSEAAAVASLCYVNGQGGIYNVGTVPDKRGQGYGTLVTRACVNKWTELGGKELFLQTETGSKVEAWYYTLGFELNFYGSIYCREES